MRRSIPNFYGAARLVAGDSGLVELRTIKPGAYPVPDTDGWWRPPHVHFSVWGRVWLSRLVTQMFFPGEPLNEHDAILNAIRDPEARSRCIARLVPSEDAASSIYEYQLVVRGRKASPGTAMTAHSFPPAEMTLGPFFPREFAARRERPHAEGAATGEAIEITRPRDRSSTARALDNVVLEIWQADARRAACDNPDFPGWGRAATDAQGDYLLQHHQARRDRRAARRTSTS